MLKIRKEQSGEGLPNILVYLLQKSKCSHCICICKNVHFDVLKNSFTVFIKFGICHQKENQGIAASNALKSSVQILHFKLLLISSCSVIEEHLRIEEINRHEVQLVY